MIKIIKKGMFCLVAGILLNTSLDAQVTIGSSKTPLPGALLDLKEYGETKKGLLLPRVSLVSMQRLEPMFAYEDEASTPDEEKLKSYKGLIVYNIGVEQRGACDYSPNYLDLGMYVWNGKEWVAVGKKNKSNKADDIIKIVVRNPEVKIFTDRRGGKEEQYTCRKFGDAIWMTMNLRATEYSKKSNASVILKKGGTVPGVVATTGAFYFAPYPTFKDGNSKDKYHGFDDYWLKQNKLAGYLYSYEAMTGGSSVPMNSSVLVQGLCPDGWHVPRLKEFQDLKLHIQNNQDKYLEPSSQNTSTIKYSDAFIVPCSPFKPEELTSNSRLLKGRSLSYSDGGFGDFGVGLIPIANGNYLFSRGSHMWVYYSGRRIGDYDQSVYRITSSAYSSSEDEKNQSNQSLMFGAGLRCVKDNDQFDF